MNKRHLLCAALLAAAPVIAPMGHAEDIDIYDGNNSGAVHNVLVVLDNAANFSASAADCSYIDSAARPTLSGTAGGWEQCALNNLIHELPEGRIKLGLMMYNAGYGTNYGCDSSGRGGCLVQDLVEINASSKLALKDFIKQWVTNGNSRYNIKANNESTGTLMHEVWAYYAGKTGPSGTTYRGVANSGCQENYVIFIGNAFNNAGTPGDASSSPGEELSRAPGISNALLQPITIPSGCYGKFGENDFYRAFPLGSSSCGSVGAGQLSCGAYTMPNHTESSGLYADEWARYMAKVDLDGVPGGPRKVTTYTIGVIGPSCKPDYPAVLQSMAKEGNNGKYFAATSYDELKNAFNKILNEIDTSNSVFASSSLPVSVNAQGTYLNQIFIGMFRPAEGGNPRWLGNLKQYQLAMDTTTRIPFLADSRGESAISSANTGFISPNAISFWTSKDVSQSPDKDGGFWLKNPAGASGAFDSPDGELVEKGGVAQQLRSANLTNNYAQAVGSSQNGRRVYTYCPSGLFCNSDLTASANAFAASNLTNAQLGVSTDAERTALVNWVRGENNSTNDNDNDNDVKYGPTDKFSVRPSIHGDVLHSRPIAINYPDTNHVVVFYGSNDGVFRAVNGNKTGAIGSVPPGGELWGLILPEFYSKLKRLRDDSPVLKLATTSSSLNPQPKDYFVDGPTGLYQQIGTGANAKAYLYLTMRRGGRFLYALDVTNPTEPEVLWKKSATDLGFGELGQTWSRPRLALVKGHTNPVLIFGAGYSPSQDSEPPTTDNMGRGLFVLDAVTGNLIWAAGPTSLGSLLAGATFRTVSNMTYSIPGDIALVNRDGDRYIDKLYAADLGGNVWRIDLEVPVTLEGQTTLSSRPTHWKVSLLASLGCNTGSCASGTTPRKFFFQPSVVPVGEAGAVSSYDAVLVASGDREHPRYSTASGSAYNVTNRFYMLKDTATAKGSSVTTITEATLFDATNARYDQTGSGFYITLRAGEKAVNAPLTLGGSTNFGTNQAVAPSANSCSPNLGIARIYSVDFVTGAMLSNELRGGGMPPSANAGVTHINGEKVGFCIGCISGSENGLDKPCQSALENCYKEKTVPKKATRTYWYKK